MKDPQPWFYVLAVPAASVAAADAVAPALSNPDGVEATFQRYPRAIDAEGSTAFPEPAEYWIATFLAYDLATDGAPSREALEAAIPSSPALSAILWWRMDNPYIPGSAGPILRAHHAACTDCVIGGPWSFKQAVAALGYA
jgi:hypothetical protein